ncbi:hypothetical protein [Rhodococcus sp. KRD162]|uniref:hypothetical protein n=1 Tax=Rhodococcus sp. KRD162 TaxID=2729725 RepID=UPI0019D14C57|nr:hypothetical protein [Rhodococcus sp. KRD162]
MGDMLGTDLDDLLGLMMATQDGIVGKRSAAVLTLVAAGSAMITDGVALADRLAEVDLAVDRCAQSWVGDASAAASMSAISEAGLVSNGAIGIKEVPDVYRSEDGTSLLPYSQASEKYIAEPDPSVRRAATASVTYLIEGAGISNLEEYARNATGDGQRDLLTAAIRPEGNNPSKAEILDWLASGASGRDLNNQWPVEIYG